MNIEQLIKTFENRIERFVWNNDAASEEENRNADKERNSHHTHTTCSRDNQILFGLIIRNKVVVPSIISKWEEERRDLSERINAD